MANQQEQQEQQQPEQQPMDDNFKQDIMKARSCVSGELAKHGIIVDVRLITTISVMTTLALKFYQNKIEGKEARDGFNKAITMYKNDNSPF